MQRQLMAFSDARRAGQWGIGIAALGWGLIYLTAVVHKIYELTSRRKREVTVFQTFSFTSKPPQDGSIAAEAEAPDPSLELAVTPLRRQ